MTAPVFITGGGGFLGATLIRELAATGRPMRLLLREGSPAPDLPEVEVVRGDLLTPESYRDALAGIETVIHLAALTGKAAAAEYQRVNVEGTERLVAAAEAAGVRNILHVSTIAAGYANKRFYSYARSKEQAEAIVKASGLSHAILRPTIVLGPASPIWGSLAKIATLPVVPLPGGGDVGVQPVAARDVARAIRIVLDDGRFDGEVLDIGGPDALPIRDLLALIRRAVSGKPARFLPVPLALTRVPLAMIEPVARPVLPATAGQLSLFANPSTARKSWLMDRLADDSQSLRSMIAELASAAADGPGSGGPTTEKTPRDVLLRECDAFTRYLSGQPADPALSDHYLAAVAARGLDREPDSAFDRRLLDLARRWPPILWLGDAWCGLFRRRSLLRRRLVLLLAIAENSPRTHARFDRAATGGPAMAMARLAWHGLAGAALLAVAALAMVPLGVWSRMKARDGR